MPASIQDIKLTVRDVLRTGWSNANMTAVTIDTKADIHTGWFDDGKDFPQVTVTSDEEGVVGGGNAGVTGIKGDGSGITQHRNGTVLVTCWAGSENAYDNRGEEQLTAQELADEVERIIYANVASVTNLDSVAVTGSRMFVDTDENPSEHRVAIEVTYNWQKN